MTPYEAFYGQLHPSPTYIKGCSKVQAVDQLLQNRTTMLAHLRENLHQPQNYMKQQVDQHRSEHQFQEGDQGAITFGIHYAACTALNLLGFTDFDWAGDSIDRKSTSGYSFSLGFGPICRSSKKQATIALPSVEVEYRGVVNITVQALWLQRFLTELGVQFHQPIVIWCDN
eukprot:PITA_05062